MKFLRDSNIWLWAILIIGVMYILVWISGVRMPLKKSVNEKVVVEREEWVDEDEWAPEEAVFGADMSDDDEMPILPKEPENIDDGRDPNAVLL